jgi:cobaltochelatase CobS
MSTTLVPRFEDFEDWTTAELRTEVRNRGLASGAVVVSARKQDLIDLLQGKRTELPTAEPPEASAANGSHNGNGHHAPDLADILAQALNGRIRAGLDETRVRELIRAELDAAIIPQRIEIHNATTGETRNLGVQHRNFPMLLAMAQARDKDGHCPPIYLHGPAGTGKTTVARKLAEALGLPFFYNGAIDSEYKLAGFIDAGGTFRSRPFFHAYSEGGIYLFDELDSSLPGALLAFNAALANGHADFPTGNVERHHDCIILAAGNTSLRGDGTPQGFQRFEMDAAFRDRFLFLDWPIDEALEEACTPDNFKHWLDIVRRTRRAVAELGTKKTDITPRATFGGIALLQAGMSEAQAIAACLRKGLPDSQWQQISTKAGIDQ